MGHKNLLKYLIAFAAIVNYIESKSEIHKRDTASLETLLQTQIDSFPLDSFVADVQFVQQVDKVNKISQYKLLNDEHQLYERFQDDSDKPVVILTKDEDKIHFNKTKRVYVVLKKSPRAQIYYSKLALLRDATAQDKSLVSINGTGQVVEWSVYDDHVIPGRSHFNLAILTCASSILVPCLFNEAALTPPGKFISAPRFSSKQSPQNLIDEVEAIRFKTGDGSDQEENYDYYRDLEVRSVQGRVLIALIAGVGGVVPQLLGTVTGLLCTVLNLLSVCPMGGGLLGRKKRAADLDKVLDYPGWKTQYLQPSKGVTLEHENEIFYGMGNCPYVKSKPEDLMNCQSAGEIIKHYMTVLRADCIPSTAVIIQSIVKDGLISISISDKQFEISTQNKSVSNQLGLSTKELLNLNTATELSAFSAVYANQAKSRQAILPKVTAPDGHKRISQSIHFIGQVCLTYLKLTREKVRSHTLHLTRNLLLNTFSMFSKLTQDSRNLENCSDCSEDKEINFNDRVYIMAFVQFIKKGLGPVERGVDVFASFNAFYKDNEVGIVKFVQVHS